MRFILYIGILMIVAAAGLTVKQYFTNLGDIAIISALSFCFAAAFTPTFINAQQRASQPEKYFGGRSSGGGGASREF